MAGRDTIFAPATARGRSAVAVVRVSGPSADAALEALTGGLPDPRRAVVRWVRRVSDGAALDQCLVLRFAEGASFTGEKSFELQCHGGVAVVSALLSALGEIPGLRLADPGEFTRRAFEAGRLDLPAAEALADLAAAETEAQRRLALTGLRGGLSADVAAWRAGLIRARALLEAVIDFADEEVPEDVAPEVSALLATAAADMRAALAGAAAAERIREGFEVALVGAPNAGKSTLLNALARREAALTSEIAGTTRDVIEVRMDLRGLPVTLLDTAGLRDTADPVEAMGVDRARRRAEAADLRLHLRAPGDPPPDPALWSDGDLAVATKADLGGPAEGLPISALTGAGIGTLTAEIAARLETRAATAGLVVRERQRLAVASGLAHVETAQALLGTGESVLELAAEELRLANAALEALLGRVDAEDVLDEIFSTFCLGK